MRRSLVLAFLCCVVWAAGARAETEIVILTGGTSGVYYPMGIALAKIYERTIPGAKVTVQSTQASVENFNLLQQRRGVLAFGQGDVMSDAFKGNVEAGFPSSRDRLRMIAAVYPNYLHLVALKSANIHSLADLKGKRVSVGAARSGNELNARVLLGAAGMSYADLKRVDYSAYTEAVVLMKDNQLDAALISAGLGVAAVRDLASAVPIDIVPIAPDLIAKTQGAFTPITIPAHTYQGQEADVETAALNNFLVTHSEVPEALVYEMIKQFYLHLPEIQASSLAARSISRDKALISRPIALHPGAARYFREVGLLK
ncbi:MAG: TAXI family TRAP transporter solute-binding subunit [Betaproteobacteria bacterium]|jgi:TRAP transporter TAXI family solute receptor